MAAKTFEEVRKEFLAAFRGIALYKHRYDVFRDFVTMSAITIRNAMVMNDALEKEYLGIIGSYQKQDQLQFPKLLALLVELLEFGPRDVLGNLFEALDKFRLDTALNHPCIYGLKFPICKVILSFERGNAHGGRVPHFFSPKGSPPWPRQQRSTRSRRCLTATLR